MRSVKTLFVLLTAGCIGSVNAADYFSCDFTELTAKNGTQVVKASSAQKEFRSVTGFGYSGRGGLFAMDSLEDFAQVAKMQPLKPHSALIFNGLKNFPASEGSCEMWIAPYFNQVHAYRGSKDTKLKLSYIFSLFCNKKGTNFARDGKSTIFAYIHGKQLKVHFVFADGKTAVLSTSVAKWKAKQFRKITLTWKKGNQRLYIDQKLAAESAKEGTLADFNSIEIGGRDFNLSFQGVIDDIKIFPGMPKDVNSPDFEGNPQTFKSVPIAPGTLDVWKNDVKTTALNVKKKTGLISFNYTGQQEYSLWTRMVKTVSVRPGSVLRTDFVFRKNKWQYGSRADFQIEFLDDAGKSVKRHTIDASTMGGGYISMVLAELSSLTALHEKISYFNYFRVPANGTQVRLCAGFAGNPCELELLDWKLREADPAFAPWFRQPPLGTQLSYPDSPVMTDEAVRKMLASRPRTESRLVREHDRLAWHVNGKKIAPVILHNPITGSYERVTAFRKAGFSLFTSAVILGRAPYPDDYDQIWLEDGSIDVTGMEKAVYRVLRENPDAHVILNLIVYPSAYWLKNNRNELHPGKDGNPLILRNGAFTNRTSAEFPVKPGETWSPSIHSAKYRADIARVLEDVMRNFEKTDASKAVAGIYITGGDDGQFRAPVIPDSSPVAQNAFRQYLKEKYKTTAALSLAWKKTIAAWDEIKIPTGAQMKGQNNIVFTSGQPCVESDYRKFISAECTKLKRAMRKAVKTGAPRLLVGGYDCAVALSGSIWYGRGAYAHGDIIRDPYCDFLISLPGYERGRDECLIPMGLKAFTGSMRLHKKLIISEMDIRNPEQPTLGWIYRSRNWQAVHNYRTFTELLKLYAGYAAAWGGAFHAYSMGRNYYNTPEALAAWKSAAAIASAAPGEPLGDDRIAFIVDERSSDFFCHSPLGHFNSESWNRNPGHALWLSQVRFDAYLSDDLFHKEFNAPKILLLANLATLTPEKLIEIRKQYLKNGRILVYLGLPGIFSGSNMTELSKALNITFVQPETIRNRSLFVKNSSDPLLQNISGYLYAPTESRPVVHYGNVGILPQNGLQMLAHYQNTEVGGMAVRRSADGTEIFIGQPAAISPQLIRNIAKSAGIQPVSDGDDLTVCGGGLIVMGGSNRSGIRRIYYPAGVKKLECLTGQKVLQDNGKYLEFDLKYGTCAVFRCVR